jgi:Subtilase family
MAQSQRSGSHGTRWFRPGEIAFVVQTPTDGSRLRSLHSDVRAAIEKRLAGRTAGTFQPEQSRQQPIIFQSPRKPPLAFLFYELEQQDSSDAVKQVLTELDSSSLDDVRAVGGEPLAAMPSWHATAQQAAFGGGSPGSLPRPVPRSEIPRTPDARWSYVYRPTDTDLDLVDEVSGVAAANRVRVAVLDTGPKRAQVEQQARRLAATNAQLADVAALLGTDEAPPDPPDLPGQLGRARATEPPPRYSMADHGLFVASIIRGIAPHTKIEFEPVLSDHGIGELEHFLRTLAKLVSRKREDEPLIINLSLGFSPHPERMPHIWYGLNQTSDEDDLGDPVQRLIGEADERVRGQREEMRRMGGLLHLGLERLSAYLLDTNCLVVAAAGNDSTKLAVRGRPRFGPRLPARYESVLGVAATARNPQVAAGYSNMGDAWELGDHVAAFGGDVDNNDQPRDGVIGAYSAPYFPDINTGLPSTSLPNDNGWAYWSGTSFSTAIVAGIAANYWTARRAVRPKPPQADDMLYALSSEAGAYVPALRTRSIQIASEWHRA